MTTRGQRLQQNFMMFLLLPLALLGAITLVTSILSALRTLAHDRNQDEKLNYHHYVHVSTIQQEPKSLPPPSPTPRLNEEILPHPPTVHPTKKHPLPPDSSLHTMFVTPTTVHPIIHGEIFTADANRNDQPGPRIAWLMSFPNSGTSYTMMAVRKYTRVCTATNYRHEVKDSLPRPVFSDVSEDTGPFWIDRSSFSPPSNDSYVLTKTHCDGYCNAAPKCTSSKYVVSTLAFEHGCRGIPGHQWASPPTTWGPIASRAIHLLRDPLDNVVSRFHLSSKKFTEEEKMYFAKNQTGFQRFCEKWDAIQYQWELDHIDESQLWKQVNASDFDNIPCWGDFYRYISWHNNAQYLIWRLRLPSLVVHYEDYGKENTWNQFMRRMTNFLNQTQAQKSKRHPFLDGKSYHSYYTFDQQKAIWRLLQKMALPETWKIIQRYQIS